MPGAIMSVCLSFQGLKYLKMSTTQREGRWRAEGPERSTEAQSAGVPRGVGWGGGGVWEGRRSPYSVWGSGGIVPRKF